MVATTEAIGFVRRVSDIPEREIRTFVDRNAEKYLLKWRLMEGSHSALSWNWAAFFFGTIWLMYRKMWLFGVLYVIIAAIPVLNWLLIPAALMMGVFGNEIYRRHALRKYGESTTLYPASAAERIHYLGECGGVSVLAAVLTCLAIVLIAWPLILLGMLLRGG